MVSGREGGRWERVGSVGGRGTRDSWEKGDGAW